jgi:regulator of RNase E activity RraB
VAPSGAKVFVQDFYPEENIYEEKQTLLYAFVKFEGDDEELLTIEQNILECTQRLDLDYVGWRVFEGWGEFYFYGENGKGFENALSEALKPKYQYESGNRRDKKYETYKKLLLPNEVEYNRLQSESILGELEEAGDDLEAEHRVEHHAVFMTQSQRKRFIEEMQEDGFAFLQEFIDEKAEDDFVYGVVFTKLSPLSLEIIEAQTASIFPLIKQGHGRYEGWGTEALNIDEEQDEEDAAE